MTVKENKNRINVSIACLVAVCLSSYRTIYHNVKRDENKLLSLICMNCIKISKRPIQSNMSYVTFRENSEIGSQNTGGRLIQV